MYCIFHKFLVLVLPVSFYRIPVGSSVNLMKSKMTMQNLFASVLKITAGSLALQVMYIIGCQNYCG